MQVAPAVAPAGMTMVPMMLPSGQVPNILTATFLLFFFLNLTGRSALELHTCSSTLSFPGSDLTGIGAVVCLVVVQIL